MSRIINFGKGEYYHLFNRGVEKRPIFNDKRDKFRFQNLIFLCNSDQPLHLSVLRGTSKEDIYQIERADTLVSIGAYALMGNHYHLLVREKKEAGISRFMQKLSTAYTMYFNIRNQRTGSLFEGRFKARHALDDRYLKYLFAYIHLNPAQHVESSWKEKGAKNLDKIWNYVSSYHFSSLPDFLGEQRSEKKILTLDDYPHYFKTATDTRDDLFAWLSFHPDNALDQKFQG